MGAPWTPSLQNHLSNSNGNIFCNWVSSFTKTSLPYALVKSTHDCCFNPTNFGWSIHMLDICWRSQLHGFPITPGMATKWMSTKKPSSLLELSQVNSAKKHDKFGSWSQQKWSFTKEKPDTRPGKHKLWNHHAIHGKIHYFDWAIFQFANCKKLPGRVTIINHWYPH